MSTSSKPGPYGRPIQEGSAAWHGNHAPATPAPIKPTESDFREVGLTPKDAKDAVVGIREGKYLSFEDACLSQVIYGETPSVDLERSRMRAKAKRFAEIREA